MIHNYIAFLRYLVEQTLGQSAIIKIIVNLRFSFCVFTNCKCDNRILIFFFFFFTFQTIDIRKLLFFFILIFERGQARQSQTMDYKNDFIASPELLLNSRNNSSVYTDLLSASNASKELKCKQQLQPHCLLYTSRCV